MNGVVFYKGNDFYYYVSKLVQIIPTKKLVEINSRTKLKRITEVIGTFFLGGFLIHRLGKISISFSNRC
jgi:hypothetical protein